MLFFDIWVTIRLTVFPVLLAFMTLALLAMPFGGAAAVPAIGGSQQPGMTIVIGLLVYLAIFFVAFCWAAVGWHRYALLSERPGAVLPRLNLALVWAYVLAGLRVGLMGAVLMVPLLAVLLLVLANSGPESFPLIMLLMAVPLLLVSARILRYSLVMPAAALGQHMTLAEAIAATRDRTGSFIALTVALTVIGKIAELDYGTNWAGMAISLLTYWFSIAIGLSVLTALYGVCVENRSLD